MILPCTIVNAFQIEYSREILNGLILAFAAAVIFHILLLGLPYVLRRKMNLSPVEQASLSYPNCGEILIPLVVSVLSQEMQIYCCAFLIVQICFLFTHGMTLISGQKGFAIKLILKNVNVIAIVIGLIIFLLDIRIPAIIKNSIDSFAGMVAPVCMLVIGIAISGSKLKDMLKVRNFGLCLIRLIIMPLGCLLLIKMSHAADLIEGGKEILLIVFMATASSPAATVANMAQKYDKNSKEASMINVLSVLLLIITLPLMVMLYQIIV